MRCFPIFCLSEIYNICLSDETYLWNEYNGFKILVIFVFLLMNYLLYWIERYQNRIVFAVSHFTWNQTTYLLPPCQSGDCKSNPVLSYSNAVSYWMGWNWNMIVFPVSRFTWNQTSYFLLPSQSGDCESNPVLSCR